MLVLPLLMIVLVLTLLATLKIARGRASTAAAYGEDWAISAPGAKNVFASTAFSSEEGAAYNATFVRLPFLPLTHCGFSLTRFHEMTLFHEILFRRIHIHRIQFWSAQHNMIVVHSFLKMKACQMITVRLEVAPFQP